jgi:hypothetical protein
VRSLAIGTGALMLVPAAILAIALHAGAGPAQIELFPECFRACLLTWTVQSRCSFPYQLASDFRREFSDPVR